jgi:multisubunit Na+/H+ antiporter MnhE subunit
MRSFLVNLVIAVVWLLLSDQPSPGAFVIGLMIGFALLAAFRSILGSQDYVRRCVGVVGFGALFLREFIVANGKVAWVVLFRRRESLSPNLLTYDVSDLVPVEILILSYCITLTPGTTAVEISEDMRTLVVHALEAEDPEAIRAQIDRTLKRPILRFTR